MKGHITLSRPFGDGCDYIEITMEDGSSGVQFLRVKIGYVDFAKLLTGQGYMPCEFELRGIENVGNTVERKTENVWVPLGPSATRHQRAETAVAYLEKNGWTGRVSNAMNHHKRVSGDAEGEWYQVTFIRYVESELDEEQ